MYMNFDEKHSPNVLENQTRLQNSAYTTRKNLIFRVFCALFEQIPSGINRNILKNPTWCGAKNSNRLCTASFGHVDSPLCLWIGLFSIRPELADSFLKVITSERREFPHMKYMLTSLRRLHFSRVWCGGKQTGIHKKSYPCEKWRKIYQVGEATLISSTIIFYRYNGSVVERPLCDREVAGSIPVRVTPKTLKMVLAALSLGAQH